jgi:D-alanyl-D-alanine endopeptidase (penicillin-binding protein 7)
MRRPVLAFTALTAALAVAGFGIWYSLPSQHTPQAQAPAQAVAAAPAASTPAQPASGAASAAAAGAAELAAAEPAGEQADSATGLDQFLPGQSVARAAGLHKTPDPLKLDASAALVMDAHSHDVVYAKNEDAVLPIASITKLMTAMVTLDAHLAMDAVIEVTPDDVDAQRHSRSRVRVGTPMTRDEALHLALMSSENRAAHALGRTYPGGIDAFVKAMNRKAQQLGMKNTRYVDPTGLSSDNRSTARDLATAVIAASQYPLLRAYSTTPRLQATLNGRAANYINSDSLVRSGKWDIALQKTGYIVEAGHCVVLRTKIAGRDMVMVLLDAGSNGRRAGDAAKVRKWVEAGLPGEGSVAAATNGRGG